MMSETRYLLEPFTLQGIRIRPEGIPAIHVVHDWLAQCKYTIAEPNG